MVRTIFYRDIQIVRCFLSNLNFIIKISHNIDFCSISYLSLDIKMGKILKVLYGAERVKNLYLLVITKKQSTIFLYYISIFLCTIFQFLNIE